MVKGILRKVSIPLRKFRKDNKECIDMLDSQSFHPSKEV